MERDISSEVASRILRYRKQQGISQFELADRAGLHFSYIGQLERGEKTPKIGTLYKVSDALGVTLSEFFKDIEKTKTGNDTPEDYALKCYKIIATLPVDKQKKILGVIEKIVDYLFEND